MSTSEFANFWLTHSKSEAEITHCARAKYIPDGNGGMRLANICFAPKPLFKEDGYEPLNPIAPDRALLRLREVCDPRYDADEVLERSIRRAKENAFDIIICNNFTHFTTLTFDGSLTDRTSYDEVYSRIKVFFGNLVQRHDFKYVCVPEHHHDGEAIHFHLLSNENGLKLVNSGHKRGGKVVWNVDNWKWGFSTAIRVTGEDAHVKVSKYIFKYMGKQLEQGETKIGGRYFLSGGALIRPTYVYAETPEELGELSQATYAKTKYTPIGEYNVWSFI